MADKNQFYEDMLDKAIEYAGKEIEDDFYAQFSDEFADEEVDLPEDFDQKMKAMFAEAHTEEKKELRKKLRPRRIRNIAATILVTICVGSACIMSVDAWRVKIFNAVFGIIEGGQSVKYEDPDINSNKKIDVEWISILPEYVPDGYEVCDVCEVGTKKSVTYTNGAKDSLWFEVSDVPITSFSIFSELSEKIDINNVDGYYTCKDGIKTLIWDLNGNVFRLSGCLDKEVMIKIAKSVTA